MRLCSLMELTSEWLGLIWIRGRAVSPQPSTSLCYVSRELFRTMGIKRRKFSLMASLNL